MTYLLLSAGVFKGWALGANDAANVFGTAVASRVIKYRTAIILIAIFVILGGYFGGAGNIDKVNDLAVKNGVTADNIFDIALKAFIIDVCAAITVYLLTVLKMAVSSNQATTGAIIGWGLVYADNMVANIPEILKFVSTWFVSPTMAAVVAFIFVKISNKFLVPNISKIGKYDLIVKVGFIVAGIISAYNLGANSSAGITALYYGENNLLQNAQFASLIGAISIAFGVLTYSKKVMETIGNDIVTVTPINGFLVVLASAVVMFIFSNEMVGINIPVSTSQAVVGALAGVGLTSGVKSINMGTLKKIGVAWIASPTVAGLLTFIIGMLTKGYFAK